MKRILTTLTFALILAVMMVPPASAAPITLTDANSTAVIDPTNQFGMFDWSIDNYDVMYQQWFWYRVGNNPEQSIDTIGTPAQTLLGTNGVDLLYRANNFTLQITYTLTGGAAGSHIADIAETIKVVNTGATALDFHFFQYSDFDLSPNLVDIVNIDPSLRFVDQVPVGPGGPMMTETVVTPRPSHAEANYFANTRNKLNDGGPTTLDDVLHAGPGDVTWAFQWDKILNGNGGTLIISKDKNVAPTPEPGSMLLMGGALVFLSRLASRLRKRS